MKELRYKEMYLQMKELRYKGLYLQMKELRYKCDQRHSLKEWPDWWQ